MEKIELRELKKQEKLKEIKKTTKGLTQIETGQPHRSESHLALVLANHAITASKRESRSLDLQESRKRLENYQKKDKNKQSPKSNR